MAVKIDNTILINKLIPVAAELTKLYIEVAGTVSAGYPSEAYNYIENILTGCR